MACSRDQSKPSTSAASCEAESRITPSLIGGQRNAPCSKPLPQQHQAGPVPGEDLQPVGSLAAEDEDRAQERIVLELLAHQRRKAVGAAPEVHRLRRHQHPNAGRNGNHVAARTARNTAVNSTGSIPGATRTVAAPITISISEAPPQCSAAIGIDEQARPVSTSTGANVTRRSPLAAPCRSACRRQPNNCCGVSPCRRATADTVSPPRQLSATISAFCSAVQARRRPVPVNTSSRRTGSPSGLDLCKSSVSGMCPTRST